MTFSSHPPSVPLFHSIGDGTVEQTLNQRNNPWNINGTSSLKALADKVLERNNKGKKPGTAPSKSVPHPDQPVPLSGTNVEVGFKAEIDNTLLHDHEERLAIAEYDGHQTNPQAQRIAYQDAFVSVLVKLPQESFLESSKGDWLDHRIMEAKIWLTTQGLEQPE